MPAQMLRIMKGACQRLMTSAKDCMEKRDYAQAIKFFTKCIEMDDNEEAQKLGGSYFGKAGYGYAAAAAEANKIAEEEFLFE